jgi:uncharacterized LabA/DUF88 family protein
MNPADTAIFFDIENLIGGYGSTVDFDISLKAITAKILDNEMVSRIAIKRAYANWSDRRLTAIQNDIIALGIEPVQMFGFSKGIIKNASDIQLVLDAADFIHTQPNITTYVIISGDGGFGALANRLHAYGKYVIGCSEAKSCNKIFKALCDDFITLDPHLAKTETTVAPKPKSKGSKSKSKPQTKPKAKAKAKRTPKTPEPPTPKPQPAPQPKHTQPLTIDRRQRTPTSYAT